MVAAAVIFIHCCATAGACPGNRVMVKVALRSALCVCATATVVPCGAIVALRRTQAQVRGRRQEMAQGAAGANCAAVAQQARMPGAGEHPARSPDRHVDSGCDWLGRAAGHKRCSRCYPRGGG
jgi:hypothetical protein